MTDNVSDAGATSGSTGRQPDIASRVDPALPSIARVYNAFLGGLFLKTHTVR